MKKIITVLMMCSIMKGNAQLTVAEQGRINNLLKQMTVAEKVGQMTQLTLAVIANNGWANEDGSLNKTELKRVIHEYHVGSMLNTTAHALPLETWKKVITEIQDEAHSSRLKIPVIYGLDAMHGQNYTLESTLFPHNLALAATRNVKWVEQAAKITAKELRASGVRWNFAPVLDIGRNPLWSRFSETYGEDVLLGKVLGSAAVRAYEEDGLRNPTAVASCMKHYLGYSASRTGKDRTPIYLPEIELREYYLPQFREAIKAGSSTIMINSSEINGVPTHADKYLLTDVLRNELGFKGLVVTDWEDIIRLHTIHNIAATLLEAVAMSINAGIDMSMVPSDFSFNELLIEAIQKKMVPMSRIDEAVRRVLELKFKTGLFDNAYPEDAAIANFGLPQYQQVALDAAREAMTLLKNRKEILPLNPAAKVMVAGPAAQSYSALNGCWSYTWQGNDDRWYPADSRTILQALQDKMGKENVFTSTGKGFNNPANYDIAALKNMAAKADVIILCIGEDAYAESPGNTRDLALPDNQKALIRAAAETGKPIVLVLSTGRPLFFTDVEGLADAVLLTYWSGKKSGEAIADVLSGTYNPSGILPFSYPRSMGEMVLYDRKHTENKREILNENVTWDGYNPLYAFGHGLSYTTFAYSPITLNTDKLKGHGSIEATIEITNTGEREGMHTVELYTRDLYASITPNWRRLRAFQKVSLKKGEKQKLTFILTKEELAFVNAQLKTVTEPGEFEIIIGQQKKIFSYEQ